MEKLQLESLFKINGIGSASGLIYKNNSLLIIGDNSGFLYEYQIDSKDLKRHPLIENPTENILKKDKPDYEAITNFSEDLYIFGSGSTNMRNSMVHLNASSKKVIGINNLSELYAAMQDLAKVNAEDFNLEGAIYNGKTWFLFNRGNGVANRNVLFIIEGENLQDKLSIRSIDYILPELQGIRTSFTDAIIVDSIIYFLATAEDTASTYDDGEVLGSIIGGIDLKTMQISFTEKISDSHKFEGLTLYSQSTEKIEFLLCEDTDTEVLETYIYKLSIDIELLQK
ncbi:hypothetical protein SAMN05444372_102264 [Flavobacterium micromati]|uniref:Uncharacterized protein n=1 Tax=Flavobacterium micromati TaxID=229205 RepID=A0A1M5H2H9_9FLAO|nr:hypothetical protein [Flavobacterium micromati]SHG10261.1 hypothetical protein SAMN05444372_102264 [Flavobacterium micromati]